MASDRSRRLTADQARELFRNLNDEESENSLDECDSDFSSNECRSRVIIQKLEGDLVSATLMIGGRCPDQVDLAYIVFTCEENSANNHPFLNVHLISFDSMYNMCNLKFK